MVCQNLYHELGQHTQPRLIILSPQTFIYGHFPVWKLFGKAGKLCRDARALATAQSRPHCRAFDAIVCLPSLVLLTVTKGIGSSELSACSCSNRII